MFLDYLGIADKAPNDRIVRFGNQSVRRRENQSPHVAFYDTRYLHFGKGSLP
jgi:hypothetical protein